MGRDTKIQWAHHTMNPWRGCTKVSAGCLHCYAESLSKRNPAVLGKWGPGGTRVVASEAKWAEPLKWDRLARNSAERHRVFCASLADVFEDWNGPIVNSRGEVQATVSDSGLPVATMHNVRRMLAILIWETQGLDWLLLTKRPENAKEMIYRMWFPDAEWPGNYWLGASVEDQEMADLRIPHLLDTPAPIHWLSMEPLLGPVDLGPWLAMLDWVVVGGESGPHARPCNLDWIRSIRDQCQGAGVPCFIKQLGTVNAKAGNAKDGHGGDWDEWRDEFRVRELPSMAKAVAR
jgi:protein gp37